MISILKRLLNISNSKITLKTKTLYLIQLDKGKISQH